MFVQLAENLFKKSDFATCRRLILAVSGGGDSLALLFLVRDYLKTLPSPPEMIVVTIDHQLRKESAHEAKSVSEICRIYQIKHIIVRWEGEKPKTNISEKSRIARYNLLFDEAQKQGATLIMTGHTLNDQVETYQMRSQRISKTVNILQQKKDETYQTHSQHIRENISLFQQEKGSNACTEIETKSVTNGTPKNSDELVYERGLSCIPREALLRQQVRLIRPLLGIEREILRDYLRFRGETWIDDPTNENLNFERARVRRSMHSEKLTILAKKVNHAALKRRLQTQKIADLILALDIAVEYGRCFIGKPAPFLSQHPDFPFIVGLFAVLMGGSPYLLSHKKLRALNQRLCLEHFEKKRFTLAGSVIEYNQNGITFWREARNIKETVVEPGKTFVWDGRYQISNHGEESIKVGTANLSQLKGYLDNGITLDNGTMEPKRPHFPSLQSLLMISNDKMTDIPELTYPSPFMTSNNKIIDHSQSINPFHPQYKITIRRIMAPFNWLLSREDAAIVSVVGPFFNIEWKR
ncbi:tRNA(Ile)-lysidine synthetase [Bartonella australis AUST/NH1]|uniref:tRNA(Ile)-lysidine synthase n=1 Tax=Bartonella australis (strain Aust/NH1) TaxID=1094489 RepID=M1P049_BARAA|nr:tRNA lysidine(34) synthetase TilS [Bartonella australis]AGF75002.1 tRNA(Ile)-lysidine synthetase [Bartonella australis AUST/NH1]